MTKMWLIHTLRKLFSPPARSRDTRSLILGFAFQLQWKMRRGGRLHTNQIFNHTFQGEEGKKMFAKEYSFKEG